MTSPINYEPGLVHSDRFDELELHRPKILITGACGFIGSRLFARLTKDGYEVYGLDTVWRAERLPLDRFIDLDLTEEYAVVCLQKMLIDHKINVVIHLAALIQVGESQEKPDLYRQHNVEATRSVLEAMRLAGVRRLIFSSTAAVYRAPDLSPRDHQVDRDRPRVRNRRSSSPYRPLVRPSDTIRSKALKESDTLAPVSVYGKTKLEAERLIKSYVDDHGFQAFIFRFFNVGGGKEIYKPSIHLVPILVERIFKGKTVQIFGKDYPTRDGTCYRDYLHVDDLVDAVRSLLELWDKLVTNFGTSAPHRIDDQTAAEDNEEGEKKEEKEGEKEEEKEEEKKEKQGENDRIFRVYNLGMGICYSVLQVYHQVMSHYLTDYDDISADHRRFTFAPRREGDPPVLVADPSRACEELYWHTTRDLDKIISDTIGAMVG